MGRTQNTTKGEGNDPRPMKIEQRNGTVKGIRRLEDNLHEFTEY